MFCLPLLALGQTESTSASEAYAAVGLELDGVQEMVMRVIGLEEDQVGEAMMPFLSVINDARETGVVDMKDEVEKFFVDTWGITELQIRDLERVAGRYARVRSGERR